MNEQYTKLCSFVILNPGIFEDALKSGMQTAEDYRNLWLEYCSYFRRRIDWGSTEEKPLLLEFRKTIRTACDHLEQCEYSYLTLLIPIHF